MRAMVIGGNNNCLYIFLGKENIAHLSLENNQLNWEYNYEWKKHGFPISPNLPLNSNIDLFSTQNFLRNMLPEGHAFEELLKNFHISRSNTFALLRLLGRDMSGALSILHTSNVSNETKFIQLDEKELIKRLERIDRYDLIIWDDKPRLSTAGIQDKLNVVVNENGELGFGEGNLCSTHILKFEPHKLKHLVLNEYVTMQLAKACGLEVADVEMLHFGDNPALLVKRFDRELISNEEVHKKHIIDGCQALNLPPEYKYERNFGSGRDVAHIREGASFVKLFSFASKCINAAKIKSKIIDWALFNLLVFNYDAHGKNISFFVDKNGIRLAPFYDLVNIKMYENFNQEMAMAFGDEFDANEINAYQITEFAKACKLSQRLLAQRMEIITKNITNHLQNIIKNINANKDEQIYLNQYSELINNRSIFFSERIDLIRTLK